MSNPSSVSGASEQDLYYCNPLPFLHVQVGFDFFFFTVYPCKASTSDALITPDKLVSIVSCGSVTDFIAEYTRICEFRLQK